jgi:multiple sugar transport system ATP-binding protein
VTEIALKSLSKSFGAVSIIPGLDLTIRSGEFMVFVGPSGCGKSTLLRMIAGLEDISGGEMLFDGRSVRGKEPVERGIAMVFQSYALYPHMTVRQNMAFGLTLEGRLTKAEIAAKVEAAAGMLQLTPYLDRLPKQLSGGQRQRVAIGRAITRDPGVFLFDEPLSNLDAALRVATRIEIAGLHARMSGTTMIYVTHDQVEAMTLADRICVLNADHGCQTLGIRPEHLVPDPAGPWQGRVIHVENLGPDAYAYLDIGASDPLAVRRPGGTEVAPGARLRLAPLADHLHRFDAQGQRIAA